MSSENPLPSPAPGEIIFSDLVEVEVRAIAKRLQVLSELEDYPPRRTVEGINATILDIRKTCLSYWEALEPFKTEEHFPFLEAENRALGILLDYRKDHPAELAAVNKIFAEHPFQYPFGLGPPEGPSKDIFIEWLAQTDSFARDAALWTTRPNELRHPNPFLQLFTMQSASYTCARFCQIDGEERIMVHIPLQVTSQGKDLRGQVACLTFDFHSPGDREVVCIHSWHGECKDSTTHSALFRQEIS